MGRNGIILALTLIAFLMAALGYSYHVWMSIGADPAGGGGAMNGNGYAALVIGAIGSFVLGGGLMALVFYSSRRGYDDAADFKSRRDADR